MAPVFGGAAAAVSSQLSPTPLSGWAVADRFSDRARALFYARLAFLGIMLGVLAVPSWSAYLGIGGGSAFAVYFTVIAYSVANYLLLDHPRFGKPLTFATLVFDLVALGLTVSASGGLRSPMLAAQVLFTIFFALLFPRPVAMVPPILFLPIVGRLDRVLFDERPFMAPDLFLFAFYAILNGVAAYVLVYLNARDQGHMRQLRALSQVREEAIISEERIRLAREIHDGLGGSLSTLIIQSEFIAKLATDPRLQAEIAELKGQAEEAIDELRRSLTMMRRDFDLHRALEDHCARFGDRNAVPTTMKFIGRKRRLPSEMQLALFRMLQEALTNIQKHAQAKAVDAKLKYDGDLVSITVADDGVGFDQTRAKPGHYGLVNIRERAKKFRGTVDIQSAPGAGTTIHVTLVVPSEGSHVALMPTGPQG
jgi:signal transduction histidine kinase